MRKVSDSGVERLAEKKIESSLSTIDFKVKGEGLDYSFLFSTDGGETWESIADGIDAGFTSTNVAGGFTGTVIGLYASGAE